MNFPDPQDWIDVVDHLWVGLVFLGAAVIPSVLSARNHRSIKAETQVIKDQLVNGHKTFLREDLDKALAAIDAMARDVAALRQDLTVERDSRASQVDDLRNDIDRMRRR